MGVLCLTPDLQGNCSFAPFTLYSLPSFSCKSRYNCTLKPRYYLSSCFKIVFRNLFFQKDCFPETITTSPLLEPGAVRAESDLVLSLLTAKWGSRESQMSLGVKADLRFQSLSPCSCLWVEQDGPITGLTRCLLIGTFIKGFLCDRHFTWSISFTCHSNLLKYRKISIL